MPECIFCTKTALGKVIAMAHPASHTPDPMDHVLDNKHGQWEFFDRLFNEPVEVQLPTINLFGYPLQITKYMILELIVAVLIAIIFIPLARRVRSGGAGSSGGPGGCPPRVAT